MAVAKAITPWTAQNPVTDAPGYVVAAVETGFLRRHLFDVANETECVRELNLDLEESWL